MSDPTVIHKSYVSKGAFHIVTTFAPKLYFRTRYSQRYAAYLQSAIPIRAVNLSVFQPNGVNASYELPLARIESEMLGEIDAALTQVRENALAEWISAFPALTPETAYKQAFETEPVEEVIADVSYLIHQLSFDKFVGGSRINSGLSADDSADFSAPTPDQYMRALNCDLNTAYARRICDLSTLLRAEVEYRTVLDEQIEAVRGGQL